MQVLIVLMLSIGCLTIQKGATIQSYYIDYDSGYCIVNMNKDTKEKVLETCRGPRNGPPLLSPSYEQQLVMFKDIDDGKALVSYEDPLLQSKMQRVGQI